MLRSTASRLVGRIVDPVEFSASPERAEMHCRCSLVAALFRLAVCAESPRLQMRQQGD